MTKITLGSRPKNFRHAIKVPMLEGGEGRIEASFIYRTRTEFGAFVDKMVAAAGVPLEAPGSEELQFSLQRFLDQTRDKNADYILQIMDGWDLDVPFNRDNVIQLCDELPGAAAALIDAYRQALTEGRLGN
jgi:hypothetical protein